MDVAAVHAGLKALDPHYTDADAERYAALLAELERWNRKVNLTAIRDPREMITAHLQDSLAARPLLHGVAVLDVGTGAGFPGLPLAMAEPDRHFWLLDATEKKIRFVEHAAALLGLGNVTAVHARVEDYAPGHRFDTVIARAVASAPRLLETAGHHVGEDGVFVALKGRDPAGELQGLPDAWAADVIELAVPGLAPGSRHAVVMRRAG
ncbi:MAG TPA: 16S rRNA (guanine(527)-N(7))-methyltransferase RsmG [Woeseiaceae bacterium]|nr:16S rRNA (guanine(527)-N(7))-methyltransferase RsmG [Woeseiaceae bacterium]